ncbi:Sir2 family NAD-dependent protein deacetylase [Escherichia coli]
MLSRRGHRLSRFRKNKRRLRERLRQRIFFRDKVVPEAMEKPRVLVLTGAGISAESGIRTFAPQMACGKNIGLKMWQRRKVSIAILNWCKRFYNARRRQLQQPEIQPNAAHLALAKLQDALGDRFCW